MTSPGRPTTSTPRGRARSRALVERLHAVAPFLQETIERGVLAPSFVVGIAHDHAAIDATVEAVGDALLVYRRALEDGIGEHLRGRAVKPVFRARA